MVQQRHSHESRRTGCQGHRYGNQSCQGHRGQDGRLRCHDHGTGGAAGRYLCFSDGLLQDHNCGAYADHEGQGHSDQRGPLQL